jgi:CRP/FNR family transcriptional regulator
MSHPLQLPALRERLLDRFPALAALPAEELERLLRGAALHDIAEGTVLFDAHQPCTGFPLLLEGSVRVSKLAANGREIALYRVEPGQLCVLSGGCLLGAAPHAATGIAESRVQLLMLPPQVFDTLIRDSAAFRQFVFGTYGTRLVEMMAVVEDVAFRRLDVRLADLLVTRGPVIHDTHQRLADDLGSVREVVSRVLRNFEQRGWVKLARERVTVAEPAALARFAAETGGAADSKPAG